MELSNISRIYLSFHWVFDMVSLNPCILRWSFWEISDSSVYNQCVWRCVRQNIDFPSVFLCLLRVFCQNIDFSLVFECFFHQIVGFTVQNSQKQRETTNWETTAPDNGFWILQNHLRFRKTKRTKETKTKKTEDSRLGDNRVIHGFWVLLPHLLFLRRNIEDPSTVKVV